MSKKPHKQPPPVQKKPAQRPQPQPAAHKTPAPRPAPEAPLPAWWHALALAFLLLATFLAFRPGLEGELTNWDDNRYVVDRDIDNNYSPTNPFLTSLEGGNIKAMFFNDNKEHLYYMGNYHPLTMLSLSIDYARGGYEARAYKQTNLLLHLLSSLLAYALVWFFFEGKPLKLRFWMASVSALVFGLLAIHVESVTWVSERKDVLYTFFFFASLLAYLLFLRSGRLWAYAASLALFVLSLFSKGQAVSLSVTLVAIDLLRGRDWRSARLWVEKAPFFALSLLFGVLAFKAQSFGEAVRDVGEFSYFYQILFAFYGYTMYFVKMLVPNDLAAMYPYPIFVGGSPPAWYFSFLFPVLLLIGLFFWSLRRHPALAFGLAFFTINVFLVLQFVGVGSAIMADRYAYVPSLGFGIMLAWVLQWAWERRPALKLPVLAALGVFAAAQAVATHGQTQVWKDSVTLWQHTMSISPEAAVGWNNYGSAHDRVARVYEQAGDAAGRLRHKEIALGLFDNALAYKPDYSSAFYNRGTTYKDLGRFQEAVADFDQAVRLEPDLAAAYHNRGICKDNLGDFAGAIADFDMALRLDPTSYRVFSGRGVSRGKSGDLEGAIADFNLGIAAQPNNPEAYSNRGFAKVSQEKYREGIADYDIALGMRPDYAECLFNRGLAYYRLGEWQKTADDLSKALSLDPGGAKVSQATSHYFRGLALAQLGQLEPACASLRASAQLGYQPAATAAAEICP